MRSEEAQPLRLPTGSSARGPVAPARRKDEIARWSEADYVVATAGQFDLVVELVAVDRRHLLELTSRLRGLPDVVSTETFVYLEMWKQLYDWGSGMAKEDTAR